MDGCTSPSHNQHLVQNLASIQSRTRLVKFARAPRTDHYYYFYRSPRFKAPGPIILHHVVTIALHLHPVFVEPEHAEYASMALLVELNTLLVTLRRLLDYPPVVEVAFWTSFVLLRLVLYPCIAWGLIEASYYNPVVQSSGMCNAESGCYIPKFISSTPRHGVITPSVKKVAWLFVAITGLQFYTTFVLLRNIWKRRTRPADKAD